MNKEYTNAHLFEGKKIYDYALFSHRAAVSLKKSVYYFRCDCSIYYGSDRKEYGYYFILKEEDLERAIESIEKPIYITVEPKVPKKDSECNDVMIGWVIYFLVLFFGLMLRDWPGLWFWASVWFFCWRKLRLNE